MDFHRAETSASIGHEALPQERGGGLFSALEHEQVVSSKSTGILKLRNLIS